MSEDSWCAARRSERVQRAARIQSDSTRSATETDVVRAAPPTSGHEATLGPRSVALPATTPAHWARLRTRRPYRCREPLALCFSLEVHPLAVLTDCARRLVRGRAARLRRLRAHARSRDARDAATERGLADRGAEHRRH